MRAKIEPARTSALEWAPERLRSLPVSEALEEGAHLGRYGGVGDLLARSAAGFVISSAAAATRALVWKGRWVQLLAGSGQKCG